jgi:SOS response regulatory protein OraA/RecX
MRFLPRLYKELIHKAADKGLKIISARSMFEKELPSKLTSLSFNIYNRWFQGMED